MKIFGIVITFLTLWGCTSLGPDFAKKEFAPNDKVLVYFYRPSRFFQGGGGPDIYIDGVKEFRLRNGGYTYRLLTPGNHVISPRQHFNWGLDVQDKEINFIAGQEYYLRMDFSDAGVTPIIIGNIGMAEISGVTVFNIVDTRVAESEIRETKLVQ